jgi:hypothetical protein
MRVCILNHFRMRFFAHQPFSFIHHICGGRDLPLAWIGTVRKGLFTCKPQICLRFQQARSTEGRTLVVC